jgi:hypothetical protein
VRIFYSSTCARPSIDIFMRISARKEFQISVRCTAAMRILSQMESLPSTALHLEKWVAFCRDVSFLGNLHTHRWSSLSPRWSTKTKEPETLTELRASCDIFPRCRDATDRRAQLHLKCIFTFFSLSRRSSSARENSLRAAVCRNVRSFGCREPSKAQ